MNKKKAQSVNILEDQTIAGIVLDGINNKIQEQSQRLVEIAEETNAKLVFSEDALNDALGFIEKARDFVSPGNRAHILGSDLQKGGEIAEQLEVSFRNGRDVLQHLKESASILSVGKERIGPTDIVVNNSPVQLKYINGGDVGTPNHSLSHILEHLKKYPGYTKDTAIYGFPGEKGYYIMPKDQYEVLQKVFSGDTEGLNYKIVSSCKDYIDKIESETGKSISEVVRPGVTNYRDVQLGRVDKTIDLEEEKYYSHHNNEVRNIRQSEEKQNEIAEHITDASWSEAFKAAGIGAAISGVVSGGLSIYAKIKSGKPISEFNLQDWKEVGYDFAIGGFKGGISGLSIYGLTKLGGFSAPFAGAVVTTSIGVASLYIDFKNGSISENDFTDAACALSVEAGLSAIGAAIGQTLIPIPILGGVIGTVVTQSAFKIVSNIVGENEKELIAKMNKEYEELVNKLNKECKEEIIKINAYYNKLGGFIDAALSRDANNRLNGSILLAKELGVPEKEIIHNVKELDTFITE